MVGVAKILESLWWGCTKTASGIQGTQKKKHIYKLNIHTRESDSEGKSSLVSCLCSSKYVSWSLSVIAYLTFIYRWWICWSILVASPSRGCGSFWSIRQVWRSRLFYHHISNIIIISTNTGKSCRNTSNYHSQWIPPTTTTFFFLHKITTPYTPTWMFQLPCH